MFDLESIRKQCEKFNLPQIGRMFIGLYNFFGPQGWWPGDSSFEVCVGAILTQNTSWKNVEKAIKTLKAKNLLSADNLHKIEENELAGYIRSSGYYNQKAKALKNFLGFLFSQYDGNIQGMLQQETDTLRKQLLVVKGIGPETADSILLYATNKLVFVVDAYTTRITVRHGLINKNATYQDLQNLFRTNLPSDVHLFSEYHALIVRVGKTYCSNNEPKCQTCPLSKYL